MSKRKIFGFTLIEIMLSIGVAAILLAISTISWRRVILNRTLDTAINEVEAALNLASQTAKSTNGDAHIEFTAPSDANGDGSWQVYKEGNTMTSSGKISPKLWLKINPDATSIYYNAAGGIDTSKNQVNSKTTDGVTTKYVTVSIGVQSVGKQTDLNVDATTGSVQKIVEVSN